MSDTYTPSVPDIGGDHRRAAIEHTPSLDMAAGRVTLTGPLPSSAAIEPVDSIGYGVERRVG